MKFNCGLSYEDKREVYRKWHRWFAWYPIRLASKDCRWLEKLWRRDLTTVGWSPLWEYKEKHDSQNNTRR